MENKRKIGDDFEDIVLEKLGSSFRKTAGSGSVFKNGDISHPKLVIECKYRSDEKSLKVPTKELDKLIKEANKQGKDWLYIKKPSINSPTFVVLELNTFLELTEKWRDDN